MLFQQSASERAAPGAVLTLQPLHRHHKMTYNLKRLLRAGFLARHRLLRLAIHPAYDVRSKDVVVCSVNEAI
jgi:hypothetical protein